MEEQKPGPEQVRPMLRRPPPRPALFGIRIHPVVVVIVAVLLIAVGLLIAFASNPNFLPQVNPFNSVVPSPIPQP